MSSVKHEKIHQRIVAEQSEVGFLDDLDEALVAVMDAARRMGATVDWSTLTITPGEEIEVMEGGGSVQTYRQPMLMSVDTVWIEEG